MIIMSVTDFARNMKEVLNQVEFKGEEVLLVRNKRNVVKLIPQSRGGKALDVMSDLFRTLPQEAAHGWLKDSRSGSFNMEQRDPWAT